MTMVERTTVTDCGELEVAQSKGRRLVCSRCPPPHWEDYHVVVMQETDGAEDNRRQATALMPIAHIGT